MEMIHHRPANEAEEDLERLQEHLPNGQGHRSPPNLEKYHPKAKQATKRRISRQALRREARADLEREALVVCLHWYEKPPIQTLKKTVPLPVVAQCRWKMKPREERIREAEEKLLLQWTLL
jgi:hypothetical protein